jgi:hypothetical protein
MGFSPIDDISATPDDPFLRTMEEAFGGAWHGIHWAEIGMGPMESWVVYPFRRQLGTITFVEPSPLLFEEGRKYWGTDPHVRMFEGAIVEPEQAGGKVMLREATGWNRGLSHVIKLSTIVDGLKKKRPWRKVEVDGISMADVDNGYFDVVVLDMEGAEWIALKQMVSRPKILRVEMHLRKAVRNPYHDEIMGWARREGYGTPERIGRDLIFVRD